MTSQDDLFNLLNMLRSHNDNLYAHSMAVALYSSSVCSEWGWRSPSILNKVAMAGIFHDIGMKELPPDLLSKPRMDMTIEDRKFYESHTVRGQEILSTVPGIPEDIIRVACQHHESPSGRGFPYQLNRIRIHPLARIIGTVDAFCDLVLDKSKKTMTAHEALQHLYNYDKEELDPHVLKALMQIFDFPLPKDFVNLVSPSSSLK